MKAYSEYKQSRKRIIAIFMVLLMMITLIPSDLKYSKAAEKDLFDANNISMDLFKMDATYKDENGVNKSVVIQDGESYTIPYDATVGLKMHYLVADPSLIDSSSYIYTVPEGIRVDVETDKDLITGSGEKIGTVHISQSGKLTFNFDTSALHDGTDVDFYVLFNGGFSKDFEEDGHNANIKFPTGTGNFSFDMTSIGKPEISEDPTNKDVIINKSGSLVAAGGKNYVKWEIDLGNNGRSTLGGEVVDNLPAGLTYVEPASLPAELASQFTGGYPSISGNAYGKGTPSLTTSVSGQRVTFNVDNCAADYRTKITFYTLVEDSIFSPKITNGTEKVIGNTVTINPDDNTTSVSDEGTVKFKPQVIDKSVTSVSGDQITWKVEINSSNLDISGTTYEDVFGTNISEIVGGVAGISVTGSSATPAATGSGFKIDFPAGTTDKVVITYTTKVTDVQTATTNKAKLTGGSDPSFDVSDEETVPGAVMLQKTFSTYDKVAQEFTWDVVVNKDNKTLTNIVVTDTFDPSTMDFVSAKIDGVAATLDASSDVAAGKIVIKFASLTAAKTIKVVTAPKTDDAAFENTRHYVNNAKLEADELSEPINKPADTWLKLEKLKLLEKKGDITTDNSGAIEWTVTVLGQKQGPTGYVFKDTFSSNMHYLPGSFRIQNQYYDGNPDYRTPQISTTADGKQVITYTFDPATDARFLNKTDFAFEIRYSTAPNDRADALTNTTYENNAHIEADFPGDVTAEDDVTVTKTGTAGGVLDKDFFYDSHAGSREVTWTVLVNEARTDMSDIINPKLSDALPDYFNFLGGSLYRVADDGSKVPVASSDYKIINVNGNLTVKLPNIGTDCLAFVFKTEFNCLLGELPSTGVRNTVKLIGDGELYEDTSNDIENISFNSAAAGANIKREIRIMKIDSSDSNKKLEGAVFELYLEDKSTLVGTATTDENGIALFIDANSLLGEILYLKETEAPEGYKLKTDWIKIDDYDDAHLKTDPITKRKYYSKSVTNDNLTEKKGTIKLNKSDSLVSTKKLAGAEFTLYSNATMTAADVVNTKETDATGNVSFANLSVGEYWVVETKSPEGYKHEPVVIHVDISKDASNNIVIKYDIPGGTPATYTDDVFPVTNEKAKGTFKITKTDEEFAAVKLANAEFELYKDADCSVLIDRQTTGADGIATFDNLELGVTYYYKETKAPTGYNLDSTVRSVKVGQASDRVDALVEKTITNALSKGNIRITKTDDSTPAKALAGVAFLLYTVDADGTEAPYIESGVQYRVVTNVYGKASFDGLPLGKYVVKEETGLEGYSIADDQTVNLTVTTGADITFVNDVLKFGLKLLKLEKDDTASDDDNVKLSGAEFSVYTDTGARVAVGTTNADGVLTFSEIALGSYNGNFTIRETKVPNGYNKAADITITYAEAKAAATTGVAISKTVYDEKQNGSLLIKKVDTYGTALAGAEFTLYDSNKIKVGTTKSLTAAEATALGLNEGDIYFEGLKYGTYYLMETKAPVAADKIYIIDTNEYTFEITNDVTVTSVMDADGNPVNKITNEEQDTTVPIVSFVFKKVDGDGNGLAGATFEMSKKATAATTWTVIATSESDADGKVFFRRVSLEGDATTTKYKIVEKQAPHGYKLDTTEFIIDGPGWFGERYQDSNNPGETLADADIRELVVNGLSGALVSFENEKILGKIRVTKQETTSSTKLEGAKFKLYTADGTEVALTDEGGNAIQYVETNEDGIAIFENLEVGNYVVKEVGAPNGYALNTQSFNVAVTDTSLKDVLVKDAKLDVTISKRMITGTAELPGAKLTVKDSSGNVVDSWTTTTTAHKISNELLVAGETYTITEDKAPKGYAYFQEAKFKINENGSIEIISGANVTKNGQIIIARDSKIAVTIYKVDALTNKPLAGAIFEIHDADGNVVTRWTTTTAGYEAGAYITAPLPGEADKEYTLIEKSAPAEYETAPDITFTVSSDGTVKNDQGVAVTSFTVEDSHKSGVYIRKLDDNYGVVTNAGLALYKDSTSNEPIATWSTTSQAKKFLVGGGDGELEEGGTYFLVETLVPKGYAKADDIKFTIQAGKIVILSGGNADTLNYDKDTINMVDNKLMLNLKKVDMGDFALPGATLRLSTYSAANKAADVLVQDNIISTDDIISINYKKLTANTSYILEEVSAPAGYLKADPIVFKIDEKGVVTRICVLVDGEPVADTTAVVNKTIVMTDEEAGLCVGKYGVDLNAASGKKNLAGAKMRIEADLTDPNADTTFVAKEWTTTKGLESWPISDFKTGCKYILTEIEAPVGYTVADPIEFTIDDITKDVIVLGNSVENRTIYMLDQTINLSVAKLDSVTGKPVKGAEFEITDADGKVVAKWTSAKKVDIVNTIKLIGAGEDENDFPVYTLTETKAPKGYGLAAPVKFAVNKYGDMFYVTKGENGNRLLIPFTTTVGGAKVNLIKVNDVPLTTVKKVDEAGKNLPGAKLKIYAKDEAENFKPIVWNTSKEPVLYIDTNRFAVGATYIIEEIATPNGYTFANNIEFKYEGDVLYINGKKSEERTITMVNKEINLGIKKIADDTKKQLAGAVLQVKDENGKVISTFETDGTKKIIPSNKLKVPAEGFNYYQLIELEAPEGYELAKPIDFALDAAGNVFVKNKKGKYVPADEKGVVVMVDKKSKEDIPPEPPEPHTGDSTPIRIVFGVAVVALCGMLFIIRRKRRDDI